MHSILLLPCKFLFRQDSGTRGRRGTEWTGDKDSNQFHACAVPVEKHFQQGLENSPCRRKTDADVRRRVWTDIMRRRQMAARVSCSGPRTEIQPELFFLCREEGGWRGGIRERIPCCNHLLNFLFECSECCQDSICICDNALKSAPYDLRTNSRNCSIFSISVKLYATFWFVRSFYAFQTGYPKVKIMGSFIIPNYCEQIL